MEAGGYITRCLSIKKDTNKNLYIVQESLIVLAPVLMAAACYVVFVGTLTIFSSPKISHSANFSDFPGPHRLPRCPKSIPYNQDALGSTSLRHTHLRSLRYGCSLPTTRWSGADPQRFGNRS